MGSLFIHFCACKSASKYSQSLDLAVRKVILSQGDSTLNGSLLVAEHGKIVALQHFGHTDADSTSLITRRSRFNVGSAAKEIPGIAILDLIQNGKLAFDQNINTVLKDLPAWADEITIEHLLFYRSGLPPIKFQSSNSDHNANRDLRNIPRLLFKPGQGYLYSNWNNFLQAQIIQAKTGMNFQTYVNDKYFKPLGIRESFYASTSPVESKNMTRSFSLRLGDDELHNPNFKKFELCHAPLYMTIEDLFRWVEFVSRKYEAEKMEVVSFFKPTDIYNQGPLGVMEYDQSKNLIHKHGGAAYSFRTLIYRNYQTGFTILIMTNKESPRHQLNEIRDSIIDIMESD